MSVLAGRDRSPDWQRLA